MSTTTVREPDGPSAAQPAEQRTRVQGGVLDPALLVRSLPDALAKLNPATLWRNPVMFIVEIGAAWATFLAVRDTSAFSWLIVVWLWLTVLFANLAEAVAEGRGKAQAETLRRAKQDTIARRLVGNARGAKFTADSTDLEVESVPAQELRQGDFVVVDAGEVIPGDGDVVDGIASVDESAITGESAPVIRESGGDRSAVTGGTKVLSDRIVVQITQKPGESFIDRMIALVEGANRQKTPNEIALNILLAALTVIFVLAVATLQPLAVYSKSIQPGVPNSLSLDGDGVTGIVLVSLLVCLIPTTIGALLSAIGIAGMDRLVQRNVLAMSGRAVEAAGDVNTLLLDKTGTITLGNREAAEFVPVGDVDAQTLADAAQLSSLADETPEGRSVVVFAKQQYGLRERTPGRADPRHLGALHRADPDVRRRPRRDRRAWRPADAPQGSGDGGHEVGPRQRRPPDRRRRLSRRRHLGERRHTTRRRRGDRVERHHHGACPRRHPPQGRGQGGHARAIRRDAPDGHPHGDDHRRQPLTARAIADEAGVDDFLAEAKPEDKMALIKREQEGGKLVAMTGDGTNDAPALAQADVGVAMNTGTSAAKEAGNMVDLDSNPTKLIEIVEIGKQLLITRGALTTFSIANDIAKYFAIIPAMFVALYPGLDKLNIMQLHSPQSAILSAVIFNAIIIVLLIPLALRGVRYRPSSASALLGRNLYLYGIGGIVAPFVGIKLIDLAVQFIPGIS